MIKHGFHAAIDPEYTPADIEPHNPAYIHLWQQDEARCTKAFDKLLKSTNLEPIEQPQLVFPLLPAYRGKHIWRFKKHGIDYLPRITSDITTSGGNRVFLPWKLRYLGLHALCQVLSRGDYMGTRDLIGFYNRLGAGPLLKKFQCFQDPRSYKKTNAANNASVKAGQANYLQQQSCMFGHRQLPAWASCVSSELARILHNECIRVAGVLLDDFLFHSPASEGPETLQRQLDEADEIMSTLGVPCNDKGQGPSTKVVFSGILIDSVAGELSIEEEQREYILERLQEIAARDRCKRKTLESINGSLGWICYVVHHGRCRRDVIDRACRETTTYVPIKKKLRRQLRWWIDILDRRAYHPSPIWFYNEVQKSILIQSDASGDQGFGFCAAGMHVTGCWRRSLAHAIQDDMFVKELLPVTIAILLLHLVLPEHIFGSALDNSGTTSRINCGSCRSPLGRRLLRVIADALVNSRSHILADWNNREQPLAQHADQLSKILSADQWHEHASSADPPWIMDLFIQAGNRTIQTSIRIPHLGEAIPAHLRHRNR